jgi:hypothetical protein
MSSLGTTVVKAMVLVSRVTWSEPACCSGKSAMVPMGPWIYQYRATSEIARKILEQNTG